ncbi:MAG TPA: penicillin-binding protein [Bryobacteraceae bacterium]|nr:penicillin-binding protein [Bryobacteraceae bacterium]
MDEQATKRVRYLARFILLWAAAVVFRLVQLQIVRHEDFREQAVQQQEKVVEIRAPRGEILDRLGQRLAMSVPVDSVCVNPLQISDAAVASDILANILHLDASELRDRILMAAADHRGFMWVKRKISPEESESLRSLNLDWVEFRTESKRFYPNKSLAAHVIGGVDSEENGNAGIEQSLNDTLEGHAGELRVETDVKQRGYDSAIENAAQPGQNVKLTIDSRIQYIAEIELEKAVKEHHCHTGSLVAMNPKTGEILAMANYPTFDPNEPVDTGADLSPRTNLAVSTPFEPGSCFKVITLTAALETTRLRPETIIPCGNGSITIFGRTIHDHGRYPALPMEDVLARSSNIGAINVGMKVGNSNMYEYIRRFGFGKSTGVMLPGESAGVLHKLKNWQPGSIGSIAMGHEIMVTSIQLAQACSIVANGGFYVKPRIVADSQQPAPVRVLKPETAITMRQMMEGVVIKPWGTGKRARIPGYTSGGKTGTAQIVDLKTHTYTHFYNASFMGFAPVNNPAIVVVTTVHGATGEAGYGGTASAPVFREVAAAALRMMDVPKDRLDDGPPVDDRTVDANDLAIAGLTAPPTIDVPDEQAPAPAAAAEGQSLAPELPNEVVGPTVPNFRGMTMRAVVEQSAALGIPVEFKGKGLARAQRPAPGGILPPGERVRVQFAR